MKKIIIFSAIIISLFFAATSSVYAKQEISKSSIPSWFNQVFQPFQNTIKSLIVRIENLEKKVAGLEQAVADLGKKKVDFNLPNQWNVGFYKEQSGKESFILKTYIENNNNNPYTLPLPIPNTQEDCNWNGAILGHQVSARAIAHLPSGDIYGVGSCRNIEFQSIENLPESGNSFEVEIYLWWQGTEKNTKQTLTIPERPFAEHNPLNPL